MVCLLQKKKENYQQAEKRARSSAVCGEHKVDGGEQWGMGEGGRVEGDWVGLLIAGGGQNAQAAVLGSWAGGWRQL